MDETRRAEALRLAEELLSDIELARIDPMAIARKTSRLARITDNETAMRWLGYEVRGYRLDADNNFMDDGWWAANLSQRPYYDSEANGWRASPMTLGHAHATLQTAAAALGAAADPAVSLSSANPTQWVGTGGSPNMVERNAIRSQLSQNSGLIDRVVGSFHAYVTGVYRELRFGAAVETVRARVDSEIARVIPDGLNKITAALENAASDNPEHWSSAAATCRRLLKAAADQLQPPGPDRNKRKMGEDQYINRLAAWIEDHQTSGTAGAVIVSDLEHLGNRLDAFDRAGHKGAHADVDRFDAARAITGTYILLGDILSLGAADAVDQKDETTQIGGTDPGGVGSAPVTDTDGEIAEVPDVPDVADEAAANI